MLLSNAIRKPARGAGGQAVRVPSQRTGARPLILQCGEGKLEGMHPVMDLYTGSMWTTARKVVRGDLGGRVTTPIYVMSARYGVVPASQVVASYDAVLKERPRKANEVAPQDLLPLLQEQLPDVGREVDFLGSGLYAETLERAGFTVNNLDPRGIGYKLGTLKAYLLDKNR